MVVLLEMHAVIARRRVPAPVDVHVRGSGRIGIPQVRIRTIEDAADPLSLEIIDDVGERVAGQHVVSDTERKGHGIRVAVRLDLVAARRVQSGKVDRPVPPVAPLIDLAGRMRRSAQDGLAGVRIDDLERSEIIAGEALDDGMFRRVDVVANLIDQHQRALRWRDLRPVAWNGCAIRSASTQRQTERDAQRRQNM